MPLLLQFTFALVLVSILPILLCTTTMGAHPVAFLDLLNGFRFRHMKRNGNINPESAVQMSFGSPAAQNRASFSTALDITYSLNNVRYYLQKSAFELTLHICASSYSWPAL